MALALNSENDIFVDNGTIKRVIGGGQVVQDVRSRLLSYLGEWFLKTTYGVPYLEQIFVKPANLPLTESIMKSIIIQTTGVGTLGTFEMDFDNTTRIITVSFSATTTDGDAVNATINEAV